MNEVRNSKASCKTKSVAAIKERVTQTYFLKLTLGLQQQLFSSEFFPAKLGTEEKNFETTLADKKFSNTW